jgi:hypothetical protein
MTIHPLLLGDINIFSMTLDMMVLWSQNFREIAGWRIWRHRNEINFDGVSLSLHC